MVEAPSDVGVDIFRDTWEKGRKTNGTFWCLGKLVSSIKKKKKKQKTKKEKEKLRKEREEEKTVEGGRYARQKEPCLKH